MKFLCLGLFFFAVSAHGLTLEQKAAVDRYIAAKESSVSTGGASPSNVTSAAIATLKEEISQLQTRIDTLDEGAQKIQQERQEKEAERLKKIEGLKKSISSMKNQPDPYADAKWLLTYKSELQQACCYGLRNPTDVQMQEQDWKARRSRGHGPSRHRRPHRPEGSR